MRAIVYTYTFGIIECEIVAYDPKLDLYLVHSPLITCGHDGWDAPYKQDNDNNWWVEPKKVKKL